MAAAARSRIYRRTALMLGALGVALGVVLANVLTGFFASLFYGVDAGFHVDATVLLIDRGGEGESEGDCNACGWGGEPDVRAAVAYVRGRPDVESDRIGGLGLSVGGELLLQTAAHDSGLQAVVSEGAGLRSVAEQKHMPEAPREPVRWIAPITMETVAGMVLSDHLPPTDLVDLMPRIAPRPVLLVSATQGNPDEALNRAYRDAGGPTATPWEIERARHTGGLTAAPDEYERRVIGFFDDALLR